MTEVGHEGSAIPDEMCRNENIHRVKQISPKGKCPSLEDVIAALGRQLDRIILEYEINQNLEKIFTQYKNFKQRVDQFINDNVRLISRHPRDLELIVAVCRKANENKIIEEIVQQGKFAHELPHANHKIEYDILIEKAKEYEICPSPNVTPTGRVLFLTPLDTEETFSEIPEDLQKVEDVYAQALYYFDEQIIDEAHRTRESIARTIAKYEHDARYAEHVRAFVRKSEQALRDIDEEYDFCVRNVNELEAAVNWPVEREENGVTIKYKDDPEVRTATLYMEGEVDVPYSVVIALANETEYLCEYVPFCHASRTLRQQHIARKICYSRMNMPVIADREVYYYGAGFDRLKEKGAIVMISKSINDDQYFQQKSGFTIPPESGLVRLDFVYYVYQIEPITEQRCRIRAITNVDPHVRIVPMAVLNWCGRKFAFYLFEKIKKKAQSFEGSVWEKAMQENKQFYDWVDKKVKKYFAEKQLALN